MSSGQPSFQFIAWHSAQRAFTGSSRGRIFPDGLRQRNNHSIGLSGTYPQSYAGRRFVIWPAVNVLAVKVNHFPFHAGRFVRTHPGKAAKRESRAPVIGGTR